MSDLRTKRKAAGMTQAQVASLAGVSRGWIAQLENGYASNPSTVMMARVVDAIDGRPVFAKDLAGELRKWLADSTDSPFVADGARETIHAVLRWLWDKCPPE